MVHFRNEPIVVVINPKVRVEHYFIPTNNANKLLPPTKKKKKKKKRKEEKRKGFLVT
jgi:predicted P-loop ATPase/GTPase